MDERLEQLAYGYSARSDRANIGFILSRYFEFDPQQKLKDLLDLYAYFAYHQGQQYPVIDELTMATARDHFDAVERLLERVYAPRRNDPVT